MDKKIILSINSSWNIINFRKALIKRLQDHGYEIIALSPDDQHRAILESWGVKHIPLPIDSKGLTPIADLRLFFAYRRILSRICPVAFLGWTIKPNIWGSLAARTLNIPVINNISGLGTAFIRQGALTRLVRLLYRGALARSATVFFQNRHDRDLFIAYRLVGRERAALLPGSGIDLKAFKSAPSAKASPRISFLLVARLLRDKGVVEFADAARIVRVERPDIDFRLLGFLDAANRTAIDRATVEAWHREGVLTYLGEASDVRPFLAAADVVVLPSYREGMPRSLLEAAAMGKPLIATDVPGCTEIARTGENAILCRPRNAWSLANAMLAMLALAPEERDEMGRRSRAIAEDEFDTAIVEQRYLDALRRAVGDDAD